MAFIQSNFIKFNWLKVGHCTHPECMAIRGGSKSSVEFPAYCGVLIHPLKGVFLYDTGYSPYFFKETRNWPEKLYAKITPAYLKEEECLLTQLEKLNIKANDIKGIIISHIHADHIAGLKDFNCASFIIHPAALAEKLKYANSRARATLKGILSGLFPSDFNSRAVSLNDVSTVTLPSLLNPFISGWDVLGDKSAIAVSLPGHAAGQIGLYLPQKKEKDLFLVADACWSTIACKEGRLPPFLTNQFFEDKYAYAKTFNAIKGLLETQESNLIVLPSHCENAAVKWRAQRCLG